MQQYPPPQQFRPNMPMPGPGFSMPGGIRPPALSQEQLAVFSRLQSVAQKGGPEGAQAQQQLQMLQIHAAQQQQQMLIQQQQQQQFQQQPPQPHGQPQQPPGGPSQSPPISVNAAQMQALRGMSMGGAGLQGQQGGAASSPQAQAILDAQRMAMAQNAQIRELTGGGSGSGSRAEMGTPTTAGSAGKKKRNRANPAQQTLPRPPPQPRHSDSYRQQSLLPPGPPGGASHAPGSGMHAMPPGPSGPNNAQMQISGYAEAHMIEPWADALDEVDPREMAMGRFRARQELLSEIFSVDPIKDIIEQTADQDPWAGLEMTLDDLNSKVEALEKANADLEASMASSLEAYRQRLIDASTKEVEVA